MPTRYRKRCKRYDNPNDAHCLTFTCFGRKPLLADATIAAMFCDVLDAARRKEPFHLWAYVLMPEHVHLVVWPQPASTISRILRFIKRPMTDKAIVWARKENPELLLRMRRCRSSGNTSHHFWLAGGGYDRNLRSVSDVHEKIHYIHRNPVRRGLVARPEDWPWSSYRAWRKGVEHPVPIDRDTLPMLRR